MEVLASGHLTKSSLCDYGKVDVILALGDWCFKYVFRFELLIKTNFAQLTRAGMFRVIEWSSSNIYAWLEILRCSGCSKCNIEEGILQNGTLEPHHGAFLELALAMKSSRECVYWWRPSTVEEILTIEIKPGWKKGTKITFPEKGNEQRGVIPSDLVFIIDEKPHGAFKRDDNDLIATQKISLSPTHEEVVKGEGMPIPKEPSKKGNLRIKFNIKFPTRLTSEQKTGIKRLLAS
ncbi:DNAJ heat shock family protein [Actinidia rufa]|uniref:DNAJ heat shock family protein n=1 Tax=Actinidia rufa TaxID=165716 RepID=A0A7J0FU07_9ERIC|nr:DNAJ heat shock family protein [Actinidia rufa]